MGAELKVKSSLGEVMGVIKSYCPEEVNYFGNDYHAELMSAAKHVFSRLDNFSLLTECELKQQLNDYGGDYLGSDAKEGDLVWFDGECLCSKDCILDWGADQPKKDVNYSFDEIGNFVLFGLALKEFDSVLG